MRRPSPALVVATVALVFAVSGTSYAVAQLPRDSVGTKQLKRNAVTSAKVRNGSLTQADFKAGALPAGATGATGARGPSDGYVGNRAFTGLLALTGSLQPVATSPSLPAGSYIVIGRANLVAGGTAVTGVVCSLGDDAVQALGLVADQVLPLTMASGVEITSAGTITMQCQRGTGTVSVAQAAVIATRVETLTSTTS